MSDGRSPKLVGAAAVVVLVAAAVTVLVGSRRGGDDDWVGWNDYGRWTISADRTTVRTERQGLDCAEHRVRVDAAEPGVALLWFEAKARRSELGCNLKLTCSTAALFPCGETFTLPSPVPGADEVRSVCQPELTPYVTTAPGGAIPTLAPTRDGSLPIVCSPTPEPGAG